MGNPGEYECGHWYARAVASYSLFQGITGVRYDAAEKKLYLSPSIEGNFVSFIAASTGFGNVGLRGGEPFANIKQGVLEIEEIVHE
jgi:hypothetical protein